MTAPIVLFDLDGTLTDPRPGIVRSIRHALDRLACPCPSDDSLAAHIGPPLRRTFAALLDTSDPARVERAMTLFRERYAAVGLFENEVYVGVPEMLDRLSGEATLFVATGKPAVFAERIIRHFDLARYFRAVYGPDLEGRLDDKARLVAHILDTERLAPAAALMLGDRANDVQAARANGVRAIGVLWGYGSRDELMRAGAERLCQTPAEVADGLRAWGLLPPG
jgi:phosphoglycolate phosphatase